MRFKKTFKYLFIFTLILVWVFGGWPKIFNFPPEPQKAKADIETIRPTDVYTNENWTNISQGYDGNVNTNTYSSNLNKTPSMSLGGSTASEAVNAWQAKGNSWTAATVYVVFSKTAGSNDTVEVTVNNNSSTLKHTLVSSTSGAVSKQTFSQALSSADWGGGGFPNIANLRVRVSGNKSGSPDNATSYVYDVYIQGTYTPATASIAITTDGLVSFGMVALNSEQDTTASGVDDTEIAQNNGTVTENFNIKTSNATGGTQWTVGATAGSDIFVMSFSTNDGSSWEILNTVDTYESLASGVAVAGTVNLDLKIGIPTATSDYQEKSITVTIQAVIP